MVARGFEGVGRAAGFGAAVALPGILAVAGLALAGMLAAGPALVAGIAILAATGPLAAAEAAALARARAAAQAQAALEGLSADGDAAATIERLGRLWRERLGAAEAQLAAAETILAAVPDPLFLLDGRRRIVRANGAAAALLGIATPEPRDLAAALRDPAVLAAADAVLAGEAARIVEFEEPVPVERQLRARIARLERPALDGALAVLTLHDITALKRAEQTRVDFIANVSHELRTPLTALIGFIETLAGAAREDAEARARFLPIMHAQAARMARLVEDLMSLSRIELNEHVPPTGLVALPPVLRQAAASLVLRAAARRMRIVLALPPDLAEVPGEADELAQVFQNLFDNAIKYGREGTEITVTAEAARRLPGQGIFIAVAVADCGEGITREHLPRLTERFYRVDSARSREMGGTGLGLAIVKHVLNRHRGLLEIDSTPGRGSVFTVLLPTGAKKSQ